MKKNTFKIQFLIFVVVFSLFSCSSDDAAKVYDNGITTGNYFPLTEGNIWNYDNNGEQSTMYVVGINDFDGEPYYRLDDSGSEFDIDNWIAKKGATYYQKVGESLLPQSNGTTIGIDQYELKLLKDDVAVGGTWKGAIQLGVKVYTNNGVQKIPASLSYTGTIIERDAKVTLGNVTYNNVIKSTLNAVEKVNSQVFYINSEYWFAENIGMIYETGSSTADNSTKTRSLVNYTVK